MLDSFDARASVPLLEEGLPVKAIVVCSFETVVLYFVIVFDDVWI
jgi:hypothetical protein